MPSKLIQSGYKSFDRFIGGGFQSGYPWLLLCNSEAEGITVSAACVLSFNFVLKNFPVFIGATRHSWNVSMESYERTVPKTAQALRSAASAGRLLVVNFFTTPHYKPTSPAELYFDTSVYPSQIYWETTKALEKLKTSKKPLFWRLTSLSDLSNHWAERKIMDMLEPLLAWLHGNGATGVVTMNRDLVSDDFRKWAISFFPNVVYVETELGRKTEYTVRIVKSINPKASHHLMRIRITPRYEISVS